MIQHQWIGIDKTSKTPLNRQIYERILHAIQSGTLRKGDPVPASRLLAEWLQVSRTVVLSAYGQLQAEGYLEMRKGAGTFIASHTSGDEHDLTDLEDELDTELVVNTPIFLPFVHSPMSGLVHATNTVPYDFRHGVPAWDAFPLDRWQQSLLRACRRATPDTLTYGQAEGLRSLREEIARLVRSTRSIPAVPEQIVITSGATQALDIVARLILRAGEQVIVEDPTHPVLRETFRFSGGKVIPVPVDDEGMCTDQIEVCIDRHQGSPDKTKLLYITPSHQFPMGVTMSAHRRIELLNWAKKTGAFIIEDDYDSEYRYVGPKTPALAGLDTSGIVIYVGSFSKVLFPSLRIGYAILPPALIEPFLAVKWITDRMSPSLEQEALADFIQSGYYAKHVHQMGKLYAGRRSCLVSSLEQEFGDKVRYYGEEAGLHLLIELDSSADENIIAEKSLQYGAKVYPASHYFFQTRSYKPTFLLGYANLSDSQIQQGIKLLRRAEQECSAPV